MYFRNHVIFWIAKKSLHCWKTSFCVVHKDIHFDTFKSWNLNPLIPTVHRRCYILYTSIDITCRVKCTAETFNTLSFQSLISLRLFSFNLANEWDVKWCPVSNITTPLARKRPFHWITKSLLVRAARETSKFQNSSHLTNSRRRYITAILPIRRKTLSNQSIFQNFVPTDFSLTHSLSLQKLLQSQLGQHSLHLCARWARCNQNV